MPWGLLPNGAQHIGDGPASRCEEGTQQEDEESVVGWPGKRRLKDGEYGESKVWHVHGRDTSMA
jgi:hypothetical protein